MKAGERCTIHCESSSGLHGRTGVITEVVHTVVKVRLDGDIEWFLGDDEVVPESRNYDYEWQRERNLL